MNARLRSAAIIAAVAALDRVTKLYIQAHVSPLDVYPVIPKFFNIVHTENPGAAFGALADLPGEWRGLLLVWVSLAVMAAIGFMLWRAPHEGAALHWGLALVFGGALGNLLDRMFRGTVTDFLQFFFGPYEFPSFNAADSAITIGAGLLIVDLWRARRRN
jgi:signal peptidase II